ncbi:MAG: CpaF family protein [Bdellovibrionales bacterium]
MLNFKELQENYNQICKLCESASGARFVDYEEHQTKKTVDSIIEDECTKKSTEVRQRLLQEFKGYGPLENLLKDSEITEILVNNPDSVWFEKRGKLYQHNDGFLSPSSYQNTLDRIAQQSHQQLTLEKPFVEGHFNKMRVTLISDTLTGNCSVLSLRRHPESPWTLDQLNQHDWCSENDSELLRDLVNQKKNVLIIGETGSGKTSVLNALLQLVPPSERVISIEDSSEIHSPNEISIKLLTRPSNEEHLKEINQQMLLQRALRLRPDRLIMGEIRGSEAKDFLMMLATGHQGCLATLHAKSPSEALIRLEMLIQMGAPQWGLPAIRRLIFLGLQNIIITKRTESGKRVLNGVYQLSSLEDSGITLESDERFTRSTISSEML